MKDLIEEEINDVIAEVNSPNYDYKALQTKSIKRICEKLDECGFVPDTIPHKSKNGTESLQKVYFTKDNKYVFLIYVSSTKQMTAALIEKGTYDELKEKNVTLSIVDVSRLRTYYDKKHQGLIYDLVLPKKHGEWIDHIYNSPILNRESDLRRCNPIENNQYAKRRKNFTKGIDKKFHYNPAYDFRNTFALHIYAQFGLISNETLSSLQERYVEQTKNAGKASKAA